MWYDEDSKSGALPFGYRVYLGSEDDIKTA
jgi:hypothetical protein